MDTPDRNLIGTPISKFEDSPVFNYINSLSPIKPVKSLNVAQTFNSLSFASPPSVFSSPHVSSQKESRFLKRHYFSGPSKPKLPSNNGDEGNTSVGVLDSVKVSDSSVDPTENFDPGSSIIEVIDDPTNENLELPIELSRTLRYDCGSPEMNPVPIKTNPTTIQFVQEVSVERCHSFQTAMDFQGMHQLEKTKEEGTGCDWDNLISDATDLLIFESSNDAEASEGEDQKIVEPEASYFTSLVSKLPRVSTDDMQKAQPVVQVGSCNQHEMKDVAAQLSEVGEHKETDSTPQIFSSTFQNKQEVNFPLEKMDEVKYHIPFGCKQQRGIRRRCLVFEMSGAQKKKFEDESNSSSSVSSQSDGKFISDNKQFPIRPGTGSSPCMLPGIGLHLNALASSTKDLRIVKHETLASGKQLISMPISMASFHSSSEQKPQNKSLALSSMEKDMVPGDSELQIMQDNSRPSAFKVGEELNDSSPKKKRRRVDHDGESEACKRCNCKKSKCLKLYCECFAAGVYCVEPCSCQECFNKPIHEDTVLATRRQIESRNPLAFAPKVIRSSEPVPEIGEESNKTPASARHKRGCNCKKSSCLKKYCECYQGGVGCSINCRCEGCKNAFGRKDGSTSIGTEEVEPEEEEAETGEKYGVDLSSQNSGVHNDEDQYQDHVLPITFSFQICRTSVQLPFSSFGNLPQSSQPPQPEFEKKFHIFPEDGTPEILRENGSPISGVKTVSPNRKRVSPPHSECVSSPGRRSSRKLVLQSIPSFPSLTHHETDDFQ